MELPTLTAPEWLWSLGAVLPLLWWLAQPPRPRRVLWTAHRAQWLLAQAALRRRAARFHALRWLLLAATAVLVAFAVAAPTAPARPGPARLRVLLDGSASMAAVDAGGTTAFQRAVALVRQRLAALPAHVDVAVVAYGHGGFRRWAGAAARALAAPGEPGGDLPAPLAELAAHAAGGDTAVWTVTDGQGGDAALPQHGAVTCVGRAGDNAAIVGVALTDAWPAPELHLDVALQNFGAGAARGTFLCRGALQAAVEQPVDLPAGARV